MASDPNKTHKRQGSGSEHRRRTHHSSDPNKRPRSKSPEKSRPSKIENYEQGPSGPDPTLAQEPGPNDRLLPIRSASPTRRPPSPPDMFSFDELPEILTLPSIRPDNPKCPYCGYVTDTNNLGSGEYLKHLINIHAHKEGVVQEMREWTWKFDTFTPQGKRVCRIRHCDKEFRSAEDRDEHEFDMTVHGSKNKTKYPCKYRREGCFHTFSSRNSMDEHLSGQDCVGKYGKIKRKVFSDEMDVRKMAPRKSDAPKASGSGSMGPPPVPQRSSGSGNSQTKRKSGGGGTKRG